LVLLPKIPGQLAAQNDIGVYTTRLRFYFTYAMTITINEDLRAYIDPLTEDEFAALERSLLAEG
jgi:hypothetical protein